MSRFVFDINVGVPVSTEDLLIFQEQGNLKGLDLSTGDALYEIESPSMFHATVTAMEVIREYGANVGRDIELRDGYEDVEQPKKGRRKTA